MPNATKQVTFCQELDTLLALFTGLVSDVKAGKAAATVVSDAVPGLVTALAGVGSLSAELVPTNSVAVDTTVALNVVALKQVLLPGVV